VPTAADSVFFDQAGTYTVTLTGFLTCLDITVSAGTVTFAGTGLLTISGSMTLLAGTVWSNTSGAAFNSTTAGRTITTNGVSITGAITVNGIGGEWTLGSALTFTGDFTLSAGSFVTNNYNVTTPLRLNSNTSNVRVLTLGSSTLNFGNNFFQILQSNFTLNAGTSQLNYNSIGGSFITPNLTWYNVTFLGGTPSLISGPATFNNLKFSSNSTSGLAAAFIDGDLTVNGTLTLEAGASPNCRIMLASATSGTPRTITANAVASGIADFDFRDIIIAGAAAPISGTRLGDCGGNTGITGFPAAKTVYWNLAGSQNWAANGWAATSGGVPATSNFPLAQDTAVFNNAGSAGTVTLSTSIAFGSFAWNTKTIDMSARTSAITLTITQSPIIYGNWINGSGVTLTGAGQIVFSGNATQQITSSGKTFTQALVINKSVSTLVQLVDAFTTSSATAGAVTLTSGTLDLNGQTLTLSDTSTATFATATGTKNLTFNGGSLVIAASGTTAFNNAVPTGFTTTAGTGTGTISLTSASAKRFVGGSSTYNCVLNQGGAGALTIAGSNTFGNITNTYSATGATTITLTAGTTQTCTDFTATGTVGKVLTLNTTGATAIINARVRPSTLNYIAATNIVANTVPLYLGTGSTVTTCTNVFASAYVAPFTHYWVGGTGTWSTVSTANWSATSGGASGAAVPFLDENVVFDQAGTYTVTCTGALACNDITVSAGTVTFATGTSPTFAISGSMTLLAGTVWSATGILTFNATTTGKTITTNGVTINASITFNGVGGGWTLGSALTHAPDFTLTNGSFNTGNYNLTGTRLFSNNSNVRSLTLGSSTLVYGNNFLTIVSTNLTFDAGTSLLNSSNAIGLTFDCPNLTWYNVSFPVGSVISIVGPNTFNNLTIAKTGSILYQTTIGANLTVNGTLTLTAGTSAVQRTFLRSSTTGTTRTITCAAVALTDGDFQDITIAGAAAPASGTRLGDCKGNSGITFGAGVNKYWNLAAGGNWGGAIGWATTSGGTPAINDFPLAQDTAIFEATGLNSGATVTVSSGYNIGTINMSARTSNTMTLATGTTTPAIYGNWINGTGTTLSGTGQITFGGRTTQTITAAGITFTQGLTINSPSGTVTLQDALTTSRALAGAVTLSNGTLDLSGQTLTLSATATATFLTAAGTKNLTFNGGSLVLAASGTTAFNNAVPTGFTTTAGTGTGTISLTSASAKTFVGGGSTYNCTLNQGGAGALTITGANTFSNITNTYSATGATSILFTAGTTSTFTNWNASGASGNLLTIGSVTAASHTLSKASGTVNADFLSISRSTATGGATWNAGANSTDGGNNTGWLFGVFYASAFSDTATGSDTFSAAFAFLSSITETTTATDAIDTIATLNSATAETATGADAVTTIATLNPALAETATATDSVFGNFVYMVFTAETAAATDEMAGGNGLFAQLSEAVTASDSNVALMVLACQIGETATATDAVRRVTIFVGAIAELATGTDAVRALVRFTARILETTTATDVTLVAPSVYRARVAEAATALEALFPSGVFNVQFVDSATALDAVAGAYLWNPIDDNQTANWQNVNNSQSPTWTDINNSQTPGWTPVIP
jgi:hypothetical protein